MDLGLEGRVALVTGGRSGIGAAVVAALVGEGCDVAIVDLARDEAAEASLAAAEAAGRRGLFLEADVREFDDARDAVATTADRLGGFDILVCCAGIARDAVSWKMTPREWSDVIDVNLTGTFTYNRAAAERFRHGGWGRIVNVASINGLRGKLGLANYAASKGGVIALTRTMARELGRYGVTANAIAPGFVRTPLTAGLSDEILERSKRETAVERLGEPADCADLVTFLCSDRARHVTGEIIRIDGGQLA
jgi:3-oxoacyl-[acyl-carrier protein] reductase